MKSFINLVGTPQYSKWNSQHLRVKLLENGTQYPVQCRRIEIKYDGGISLHMYTSKLRKTKYFAEKKYATPGRGILKGFVYTFSIWNPEKTDEIPQDWMIYSWRCFIKKRIFICRKGIYVLLSLSRPYLPLRTQSWYPINPIFILWERYLAHEVFSILSWKISRARMPGNLIKPG